MKSRVLFLSALAATAVIAAGCGPSSAEVKRARTAHYSCDYEAVFKAVFEEVEAQQPPIAMADPDQAMVLSEPRWHDQHGLRKKRGAATVGEGDVSFNVAVAIERRHAGWFVRAVPHVISQEPESPQGMEISRDHANWPAWADGKIDKLLLGIHGKLGSCAVVAGGPESS